MALTVCHQGEVWALRLLPFYEKICLMLLQSACRRKMLLELHIYISLHEALQLKLAMVKGTEVIRQMYCK